MNRINDKLAKSIGSHSRECRNLFECRNNTKFSFSFKCLSVAFHTFCDSIINKYYILIILLSGLQQI